MTAPAAIHTAGDRPARTSLWDRFLFEPESPSPLAVVRIAWGLVAAVWAFTLLPDIDPFLTKGALRYDRPRGAGSWNPLDWIGWDKAPLVACVVLVVAALATAVGYRTRLTSAVAVLLMLSLQRTNPQIFNSGDLVLRVVGLAVALGPSGLVCSVDALRARRGRDGPISPPHRAPWALRLLQLEIAIGYSLSAWAKIRGHTWHDGTALGLAMRISDLHRFVPPDWLFHQDVLLNLLSWATLAFELSFIFLVWNRRWRPWVLAVGVAFHLGIDLVFDVGFFSVAMWVSYLAFLPPEVADRLVARFDPFIWWERSGAEPEPGSGSRQPVALPVEPAE
jgi:uncharacterized membrane protein YphA (DoxX/SURF4 family)